MADIELVDIFKKDLCIRSLNLGASGTLNLNDNGDQILYLDQVGANIALAINAVTNLNQGFFERSIIGSNTYNVSWGSEFKTKMEDVGFTLPNLGNGATKRNNIAFIWNRAEGLSTDPTERIISITNHIGKASAVPVYTEPLLVSAEIGLTSLSVLGLNFDKSVDFTGVVGISMTASGGAITATAVQSGSGTSSVKLTLSRAIANGETVTITIAAVNNITSTLGGIAFAGITGQSVMTDTAPICLSAEVGADNSQTLSVTFDRNIAASGIVGISLYNSGGAISVTSVKSVSSAVVKFNLSRVVVNGEAMTLTIDAVNNITNAVTGIAFAGVTNKLVINTVPILNYTTLIKAEVGETGQNILVLPFSIATNIVNANGITAIGSSGTAILVNGAIGGSGTNTISIYMSRSLNTAETLTISIDATNTITSAIDGTTFMPVTNYAVNHIVAVAGFTSTPSPFNLLTTNNGNGSVAYSNGCTLISTSATAADYIFLSYSMISFVGKHVRIRFKNLAVQSGALPVFGYSPIISITTVTGSHPEYVVDIPSWSSGASVGIGDHGGSVSQFSATFSKLYIEIV